MTIKETFVLSIYHRIDREKDLIKYYSNEASITTEHKMYGSVIL